MYSDHHPLPSSKLCQLFSTSSGLEFFFTSSRKGSSLQTSNEDDHKMPFSMPVPPVPPRTEKDGENSSFYGSLRLNLALFENIKMKRKREARSIYIFDV